MYVVVQHEIKDPETAFPRGEKLTNGEGAPHATRVLQFLPSRDGSAVTCLWESDSVATVQQYVDSTLGDSSVNTSYEVNADQAFSDRPSELRASPAPIVA
jgi:hypothetical protein